MRKWLIAMGLLVLGCEQAPSADLSSAVVADGASFRVVEVAGGLEHPWGMAFLPSGDVLITERPGRLRILRNGVLDPTPITGLPEIQASGQGGLLDVALDPDFADNQLIYLSYAAFGDGGSGTHVARARLNGGALEDVEVIFEGFMGSGGRHFGSRLVFDQDGYLYVTLGDRGDADRAQYLGDLAGKVVRLQPDGGVPQDNPFVGDGNAAPEVFSYGHRNPQGMTVHPETGAIWLVEHGPRGGDEVNVVKEGVNYGWPVITYGRAYSGFSIGEGTEKEGMAQPAHYWVPSISPSGMAFYEGDAFPEWQGDLFVGALSGDLLARLEINGEEVTGEERLIEYTLGRIRDVRIGPDGLIYLLNDQEEGALWRLEPA
ncbi:MAG: PQQ-dependent sugar dehydrogenase [Pseudomonadota bacterium]